MRALSLRTHDWQALAGKAPPHEIDGISMLPALLGQNQSGHEFLYWEFHKRGFDQAGRMEDWKAVRHGRKPLEVYDLNTDPHETNNVARQNPNVVARIEENLNTARSEASAWPIKAKSRRNKAG